MYEAVDRYFESGGRVCLVGVFALGSARDTFGKKLRSYFVAWEEALVARASPAGLDSDAGKATAPRTSCSAFRARWFWRAPRPTRGVFRRAMKRLRATAITQVARQRDAC